jgi:hypothetical protein
VRFFADFIASAKSDCQETRENFARVFASVAAINNTQVPDHAVKLHDGAAQRRISMEGIDEKFVTCITDLNCNHAFVVARK